MGHGQQSAFTLKYRDSHNGSHSPLTFFRKSRFADVDVPFFLIRPLRLSQSAFRREVSVVIIPSCR
ncbi:hypothetical protein, partial [Escherichia coli]|uniref:hypothetical protein n=1 Tax=Escherichia coli TaxID=562 RepID=UPI002ACC1F46